MRISNVIGLALVVAAAGGGAIALRQAEKPAPTAQAPAPTPASTPVEAAAAAPAADAAVPKAVTRGLITQPNPLTYTRTITGLARELYAYGIGGVGGDGEFDGHGPSVTLTVTLSYTETQILASVTGEAREVGGDGSRAFFDHYARTVPIYTVEQGNRILGITAPTQMRALLTYVDTDHDHDYVCPGGEVTNLYRSAPDVAPWEASCGTGLVAMARFMGDTGGRDFQHDYNGDAVDATNVVVLFNPITIRTAYSGKGLPNPGRVLAAVAPIDKPSVATFNGARAAATIMSARGFPSRNNGFDFYKWIEGSYPDVRNRISYNLPPADMARMMTGWTSYRVSYFARTWTFPADGNSRAANRDTRAALKRNLTQILTTTQRPMLALVDDSSEGLATELRRKDMNGVMSKYHSGSFVRKINPVIGTGLAYIVIYGYDPRSDTFEVFSYDYEQVNYRADYLLDLMLFEGSTGGVKSASVVF